MFKKTNKTIFLKFAYLKWLVFFHDFSLSLYILGLGNKSPLNSLSESKTQEQDVPKKLEGETKQFA